jgi:uncharacterized membrane protein
MTRLAGWCAFAALVLLGHAFDNASLRAVGAPLLLLLLAGSVAGALRIVLALLAALSLALIAAGQGDRVLDLMPALIAGAVAWLFARTLRRDSEPLIARAIAAIDGREPLADPAVARYARRLTALWAAYQAALAAIATLLAVGHWIEPALEPTPRLFGLVVLPLAVAALGLVEFLLRPRLLPQAPRRSLGAFLHSLARAWPSILND